MCIFKAFGVGCFLRMWRHLEMDPHGTVGYNQVLVTDEIIEHNKRSQYTVVKKSQLWCPAGQLLLLEGTKPSSILHKTNTPKPVSNKLAPFMCYDCTTCPGPVFCIYIHVSLGFWPEAIWGIWGLIVFAKHLFLRSKLLDYNFSHPLQ